MAPTERPLCARRGHCLKTQFLTPEWTFDAIGKPVYAFALLKLRRTRFALKTLKIMRGCATAARQGEAWCWPGSCFDRVVLT